MANGFTDETRLRRPRSPGRSLKDEFSDVIGDARDFSATDAAKTSALAQFELTKTPLLEMLETLRGNQVGRGRLNTGFGFEEEDRLFRGAFQDLNQRIASRAFQGAGLDLQALGLRGDLASGGLDRETLERNARREQRTALLGALIGGIGRVVGGAVSGGATG